MAKIGKCAICEKEIKMGLFFGDDVDLEIGSAVFIKCCSDCENNYKRFARENKKLFETKLNNYKWATGIKLRGEALNEAFKNFYEEKTAHTQLYAEEMVVGNGNFYNFSANGVFSWNERQTGFMGSDISIKDKALALASNLDNEELCFTKDDIAFIKYRICDGLSSGMFEKCFTVEICVNDPRVFSYKPCLTKTAIIVKGAFSDKKAREMAEEILETFKADIGCDLPVQCVKRFK